MKIWTNYLKFLDVIEEKRALVLPKITEWNQYTIKLQNDQQIFYKLIYSLGLRQLETLKTYIKTNFANSFIQLLKYPAGALVFFGKKPDSSFCRC